MSVLVFSDYLKKKYSYFYLTKYVLIRSNFRLEGAFSSSKFIDNIFTAP